MKSRLALNQFGDGNTSVSSATPTCCGGCCCCCCCVATVVGAPLVSGVRAYKIAKIKRVNAVAPVTLLAAIPIVVIATLILSGYIGHFALGIPVALFEVAAISRWAHGLLGQPKRWLAWSVALILISGLCFTVELPVGANLLTVWPLYLVGAVCLDAGIAYIMLRNIKHANVEINNDGDPQT